MKLSKRSLVSTVLVSLSVIAPYVNAKDQPVLVNIKRLSMDSALKIAKAAIDKCRDEGVQVSVTVVDRGGHPQVMLRDVLAPDISIEISQKKAHTAMAFNLPTAELEGRFKAFSVPKIDKLIIADGGLPINAAGTILGGIGVSGAPSGKTDEACAKAGVDAIQDDLEMMGGD